MKVKICGVNTIEDMQKLCLLKPDAIGVYFRWDPGKGPNFASPATARAIVELAKSNKIDTFFLTYLESAKEVLRACAHLGASHIQLIGDILPPDIAKIKERLPNTKMVKVIGVTDSRSISEAQKYFRSDATDELLLDSRAGAMRGATGKVHDWNISRVIAAECRKPIWLTGGLNLSNITSAMQQVRPEGIDVETGVQSSDGKKDFKVIKEFIAIVRQFSLDLT